MSLDMLPVPVFKNVFLGFSSLAGSISSINLFLTFEGESEVTTVSQKNKVKLSVQWELEHQ